MLKEQTLKEFLKGTRNNYYIAISYGGDDVFTGTYKELKASAFFKENVNSIVESWDVTPMADDTLEIGILINWRP